MKKNEIAAVISLLEEDYKTNQTFVSLNKIGKKDYFSLMEKNPDIFYFTSKSRVVLVRWICAILRHMFETFGYNDINITAEGYDEIRNTLNTRALNRETLCTLFECSKGSPLLTYQQFLVCETRYFESYNKYAAKKIEPQRSKTAVKADITNEFKGIVCSKRELEVMKARANGMTLDEVGERLGVTRERARQIECKPRQKIRRWLEVRANEILSKLCVNGVVDETKAVNTFGREKWTIIKYAITAEKGNYTWHYIKSLDKVIHDKEGLFEETANNALGEIEKENGTIKDFVQKVKNAGYSFFDEQMAQSYISGKKFHTFGANICEGKMTIGKAAIIVANKHFPKGICMTNPDELKKFSKVLNEKYDMHTKPDRALQTRVQDVLTMCAKATYCAPSQIEIDEALLSKIIKFIKNKVNQDRIPYVALYSVFEKDLIKNGINNQYALHGILKRIEKREGIICLKHYVCHNDTGSTLSKDYFDSFAKWLETHEEGKSLKEIQKHFKGWDTATVKCAMNYYEEIVQWDTDYYRNLRTIKTTPPERKKLKDILKAVTNNPFKYSSSYILYDRVKKELPKFLENNGIKGEKQLYYVAQYLFSSHYVFRRPHITADTARTTFSTEELVKLVAGTKARINKQEISAQLSTLYGNKNSSLSLALQRHLSNYIRIGTYDYYRKDKIKFSAEEVAAINDFIKNHMILKKVLLPNQIKDFSELPSIPCGWNAWVLCEVVDLLGFDYHKIDRRNTPSQSSMAIILDKSLDFETKDEVFVWLIQNDYNEKRDKSEFQYAKGTGIFHTNLTSEEIANKINL